MVASPVNMNNNNMIYDQMRAQTAGGDFLNNNFAQTAGMRTGKLKIMTADHLSSTNSSNKQQRGGGNGGRVGQRTHDTSYSTAVSPNNRSTTWNSSMLVNGAVAGQ
jgi:hypothetical protein